MGSRLTSDGVEYSHEREEILEGFSAILARQIEPLLWECCLTCLLSDYSPGGVAPALRTIVLNAGTGRSAAGAATDR